MISDSTRKYLQEIVFLSKPEPSSEAQPVIHVDYVASKIATLYEKLRQVIDFQEEHLLRKNTIERMLRRRLLLSLDSENLARLLVSELIRGGYFPNDKIPEAKIEEIQKLLDKYVFLINNVGAQKNTLVDWIGGLAALEIEDKLTPHKKEEALLNYMAEALEERLIFSETSEMSRPSGASEMSRPLGASEMSRPSGASEMNLTENRKKELIFLACQKTLLKADSILLNWRLLKLKCPEFLNSPNQKFLLNFCENIASIKKEIDLEIADPLLRKITKKAYNFSPVFLILQDIVLENKSEAQTVFENPETLESRVKFAYDNRYRALKSQNRRWGIRWLISIFLSKMLFAFLIEVPYDRINHKFSSLAMAVNLIFPPLLMILMIWSIKIPKETNKTRVLQKAMEIVYPKEKIDSIVIEKVSEKKGIGRLFLKLFFSLTSLTIFGATIMLLLKIDFSWLSILIFLAFFSLIAFSGIKIETTSKQLKIVSKEEEEAGLIGFVLDIFFLPFRTLGKWLSGQLQKYNLIILILNLFFEAPLQVFFEFLENWRDYLKKKKEEME